MGDTFAPSQEGRIAWKEAHVSDERLRLVARLLEGEKMAPLCAAFGISRKTGYKIFERYKDCGLGAFTDRSRRPYRQANRLPAPLEATIVRLKREATRRAASNRSTIPSAQKCYLCARNKSTMCPEWTFGYQSGRVDLNDRP